MDLAHEAFAAFLSDISVLGVSRVEEGGLRYAIVPARSNPRWWILPLESRRLATAGLEMLQPVTLSAHFAKVVARGLLRYGPRQLLGRDALRLSGLPNLSQAFGDKSVHVAFFTGTEGPHRKTALQIMGTEGAILGYAKLSRAAHIRPYIRNEAQTLQRLASLGIKTADVPRALSFRDDDAVTLLVTDSKKSAGFSVPRQLGFEHLAFLSELQNRTERLGARETLDKLSRRATELSFLAGPEWTTRFARVDAALRQNVDAIPVCLSHGDFTPWNTFLHGGRLYVFDWEYANDTWPVGFDLAHFFLSTRPLDRQLASLPALTTTLARAHFGGSERMAVRSLLLALVCHAVLYLGRLQETQRSLPEWTDGLNRAAMIDQLLVEHESKI